MSRHVREYMKAALTGHSLTCLEDTFEMKMFILKGADPGKDVHISSTRDGVSIQCGFGHWVSRKVLETPLQIETFAKESSEDRLCHRFLTKSWSRDFAVLDAKWNLLDARDALTCEQEAGATTCEEMIEDAKRFVEAWEAVLTRALDIQTSKLALQEFGSSLLEDFPGYEVGYRYPHEDAGWLCAIQQRFSELYLELV